MACGCWRLFGAKQVVLRKAQSGDNTADVGTKVLELDTIQQHIETQLSPVRPAESGDSWSSGVVNGHRHTRIHAELPPVQSIQTPWKGRRTPAASRGGTGSPTPSSYDACSRRRDKRGANVGFGRQHRETPSSAKTTRSTTKVKTTATVKKRCVSLDSACVRELWCSSSEGTPVWAVCHPLVSVPDLGCSTCSHDVRTPRWLKKMLHGHTSFTW